MKYYIVNAWGHPVGYFDTLKAAQAHLAWTDPQDLMNYSIKSIDLSAK
jgi:hypothetical protein